MEKVIEQITKLMIAAINKGVITNQEQSVSFLDDICQRFSYILKIDLTQKSIGEISAGIEEMEKELKALEGNE